MRTIYLFLIFLLISFFAYCQDTEPPTLIDFSFSPTSVDVSSSAKEISFSITAADDISGISTLYVLLYSPSNNTNVYKNASTGDLVSGDKLNGTYEFKLEIPMYSENGAWRVLRITLNDETGNKHEFYTNDLINLGYNTTLNVISSNPDTEPPRLVDFSFSPTSVDVSTNAKEVTFNITATDNLSGISIIYLYLNSPSGDVTIWKIGYTSDLISGDKLNGVYELKRELPMYSENGEWKVSKIILKDEIGNENDFYTNDLINLGYNTTLNVININPDTEPPKLVDFSFSPTSVDVSTSAKEVTFSIAATDNLSGISILYVYIDSPSGDITIWKNGSINNLISGDKLNGSFEIKKEIPIYGEGGEWKVRQIYLKDEAGNENALFTNDLINLGYNTNLNVISSNHDVEPPRLIDFSFSPTSVDVSTSTKEIVFSIAAADNLSGISTLSVLLYSPSDETYVFKNASNSDLISGDKLNGTYEFKLEIPIYCENGAWKVRRILLKDETGNENALFTNDLINFGYNTTLNVININPDTEPPKLIDFSFSPTSVDVSTSAKEVTFSITATDNLSGISIIYLYLNSPSGDVTIWKIGYTSDLISGDKLNGVYELKRELPMYSEDGEWKVSKIILKDEIGNENDFYTNDLINFGYNTTLNVININPDTEPPKLIDFSFSPTSVDVSTSAKEITFSITATDNLSGISILYVYIDSPSGDITIWKNGSINNLISGDKLNGSFEIKKEIPIYGESGEWKVRQIYLKDDAGNEYTFDSSELADFGYNTTISVKGCIILTKESIEICQGDTYMGWSQAGSYERTLSSIHGCDSIVTTNLIVNQTYNTTENIEICQGEDYKGWTTTGSYQRTLKTFNGCDSIVNTNLTVYPTYQIPESIEICQGEKYQGWSQTGSYKRTLSSIHGCDSIVTTNLIVNPTYNITEDIEICQGEEYKGWTTTGSYQRTLKTFNGCDSIVNTNLLVHPTYNMTETIEICQGEKYQGWSQTVTYETILSSVHGCDSIVITNLIVNQAYNTTEDIEICQGNEYKGWTSAGNYQQVLATVKGCDSIVNTNLTVHPTYQISESIEICQGEKYQGWSQPGTYERTLSSIHGCDSIVTTNLIVNPTYNITEDIEICQGEEYKGWTITGSYQRTLKTFNGCDSIVNTNLLVHPTYNMTETIEICQGEKYQGWSQAGSYKSILSSIHGCDSIVITNLIVNQAYNTTEDIEICQGNEYKGWTSAGNYQQVLATVKGCDSIVNTNLTVHPTYQVSESIEICQGDEYKGWTMTGSYQQILATGYGCDSIVNTDLIVFALPNKPRISVGNNTLEVIDFYENYQWLKNGEILLNDTSQSIVIESSGDYSVTVCNNENCKNESDVVTIIYSSIENISNSLNVNILPNPNNGIFYLQIEDHNKSNVIIEIINSIGEKIHSEEFGTWNNSNKVSFNLNKIDKGNYYIRVISNNSVVIKKMIVL